MLDRAQQRKGRDALGHREVRDVRSQELLDPSVRRLEANHRVRNPDLGDPGPGHWEGLDPWNQ